MLILFFFLFKPRAPNALIAAVKIFGYNLTYCFEISLLENNQEG